MSIATDEEADDVMFCFGASLDSEPYLIGDMVGRKREWRWIKIGECG